VVQGHLRRNSYEHDSPFGGGGAEVHSNGVGTLALVSAERLKSLLTEAFPDADELDVQDRTGGGDHFQVIVTARSLTGLSLVEQHRRVYEALATPLADGTIHELRIKTKGST
jgi:stress-induced morphogen